MPAEDFGSSPHTWGILIHSTSLRTIIRFIPTYVGHTAVATEKAGAMAVHPHIRGAYRLKCHDARSVDGSSPPTWGIPSPSLVSEMWTRFIPTYVGHTRFNGSAFSMFPVHPHLRGAYPQALGFVSSIFGSSPPTWGIRYPAKPCQFPRRFIPTYVGHTSPSPSVPSCPSVHPHLRGAYGGIYPDEITDFGSSPPTWGIPEKFS